MRLYRNLINHIGARFLSFKNPRVVCPPGIIPTETGKPIIVASIMRSGTHLAIDLLLNNFPELARKPLYVDSDQFFRCAENRKNFILGEKRFGACVLKTHYPEWLPEEKESVFRRLANESHVIVLRRPIEDTYKSLSSWGIAKDFGRYRKSVDEFYHFWQEAAPHRIEITFSELTDRNSFEALVPKIANEFNICSRRSIRYPVNPRKVGRMVITKLATRLLGKYSPVINTGIRSGMSGG